MTHIQKRAEFLQKAWLRALCQSLFCKITTALTCEIFDFYMTIALTFKSILWRRLSSTLKLSTKLSAKQRFSKIRFSQWLERWLVRVWRCRTTAALSFQKDICKMTMALTFENLNKMLTLRVGDVENDDALNRKCSPFYHAQKMV